MKTYKTTVFTFEELDDQAKQRAIDNARSTGIMENEWAISEALESLRAFCDATGVKLRDYSIGLYGRSYVKMDAPDLDCEGVRLATWIVNNWHRALYAGKYYSTAGNWINGSYTYKSRRSKVILDRAYLTGLYIDLAITDPLVEFIKKPTTGITLQDLIDRCADSFLSDLLDELRGMDSSEYIADHLIANDYEFLADGSLFSGNGEIAA